MFQLALRLVAGLDRLQVMDHSGVVLRGFTERPPASHASLHGGSPTVPVQHLYLRAYRVGTRGMLLHLVLEGEKTTTFRLRPKNATNRRRQGSLASDLFITRRDQRD